MKKGKIEIIYYFLLFPHIGWFRSSNQWPHLHCLHSTPEVLNISGARYWLHGRQLFHGLGSGGGGGGNGFKMIQRRYICCALHFYFVAISGYSALTLGSGFTLLWELNAAADLKGGRTWVVTWARRNGCKYRWSFASCPPTPPHLLLCGLVCGGFGTTTPPHLSPGLYLASLSVWASLT